MTCVHQSASFAFNVTIDAKGHGSTCRHNHSYKYWQKTTMA